jgi:hypothetical protein
LLLAPAGLLLAPLALLVLCRDRLGEGLVDRDRIELDETEQDELGQA